MTIDTAEDDVGRGVHRFDAGVALIATSALCVGLRLGLVDPVAGRTDGGAGDRFVRGDGGGWAVAGAGILRSGGDRKGKEQEEKKTSNVQRPTFNAQLFNSTHRLATLDVEP